MPGRKRKSPEVQDEKKKDDRKQNLCACLQILFVYMLVKLCLSNLALTKYSEFCLCTGELKVTYHLDMETIQKHHQIVDEKRKGVIIPCLPPDLCKIANEYLQKVYKVEVSKTMFCNLAQTLFVSSTQQQSNVRIKM